MSYYPPPTPEILQISSIKLIFSFFGESGGGPGGGTVCVCLHNFCQKQVASNNLPTSPDEHFLYALFTLYILI